MNNVTLQHFEKNDMINNQIYSRNIPSSNIENHFSFRPVQTKYNVMPILDNRKETIVKMNTRGSYNSEETFFPGTRRPHFSGFSSNVDEESLLRNQFFALQKSDKAVWVPNSTSDLYMTNNANYINSNRNLDGDLLFRQESFNNFNPNLSNHIGSNIFNNSTRVQLKDL